MRFYFYKFLLQEEFVLFFLVVAKIFSLVSHDNGFSAFGF